MTSLPDKTERKLGLVIDLDTCVGCHACVISCKGWNTENYGSPLADVDAYGDFLIEFTRTKLLLMKVLHN